MLGLVTQAGLDHQEEVVVRVGRQVQPNLLERRREILAGQELQVDTPSAPDVKQVRVVRVLEISRRSKA